MRSRLAVLTMAILVTASLPPTLATDVRKLRRDSQERPRREGVLDPAPVNLRVGLARPGGGYTITTIPLETYVARVLAGEAARESPPAALEALAITVRTYALANRSRHRADGFDVCDETHCQVLRPATAATERASQATAGRILLYEGTVASVYYSASCGGRTEIPSAVWPGAEDPPYLPSRRDDGCGGAPVWDAELSAADLYRALRAGGFHGDRLRNIRVASRNSSGRVARLRLEGLEPGRISGQDLRVVVGRTLGWQHIRSTAFDVARKGDRYRFSGHGSGHGVGMCVIGSTRLAAQGRSARDILNRYYPGLTIGAISTSAVTVVQGAPLPPVAPIAPNRSNAPASTKAAPARSESTAAMAPEVLLSLPDGDEGERGIIGAVTDQARLDLSRTLGLPVPRVTIRFHPTVDSYERAADRPWFTLGAVVNGEIHLLPLTVLRDRGTLERTIRHELVHVMADAVFGGRPAWVREGAATYFSGESPVSGQREPQTRASCPEDAELIRPVSAGALTSAYARAHACFQRQLEQRKSWRDVR